MELPNEAVTIETPHISPPIMTTGRLPKRRTNTLLTGPGKEEGKAIIGFVFYYTPLQCLHVLSSQNPKFQSILYVTGQHEMK